MGDRVRNLLCHRAHSDLKSVANFSFSTAALRFSDGLTKDEVFTSLRAIIQSIGDHASKHAVRIEFSVGTLFLGKHRNQFTFNKRLRGLIDPDSCEIDDYTEVSSGHSEIHPDDSVSVISSNRRRSRQPSSVSVAVSQARSSSETPPKIPLISGENRKDSAYKAALQRHLSDLEVRASEAVRSRKEWEEQVKSSKLLSELEMESRRKKERENAQFLLQQISDSSSRKKSQRKDEIEETNRLVGFPRFTESPESELKNQLRTNGEQIRSELDNQVHAMKSLRTAAYTRDKEIAIKLNELSRRELEEVRRTENAKRNEERDILRNSWNRDIDIKNYWKNIEQFDMLPEKFCSSKVGILLPRVSDDETRSQILGGSSRRSLTGSVRKR